MNGTSIAGPGNVIRRFFAIIGILLVLGLAVALMWRVYLHRERSRTPPDEPTLVLHSPFGNGEWRTANGGVIVS